MERSPPGNGSWALAVKEHRATTNLPANQPTTGPRGEKGRTTSQGIVACGCPCVTNSYESEIAPRKYAIQDAALLRARAGRCGCVPGWRYVAKRRSRHASDGPAQVCMQEGADAAAAPAQEENAPPAKRVCDFRAAMAMVVRSADWPPSHSSNGGRSRHTARARSARRLAFATRALVSRWMKLSSRRIPRVATTATIKRLDEHD